MLINTVYILLVYAHGEQVTLSCMGNVAACHLVQVLAALYSCQAACRLSYEEGNYRNVVCFAVCYPVGSYRTDYQVSHKQGFLAWNSLAGDRAPG